MVNTSVTHRKMANGLAAYHAWAEALGRDDWTFTWVDRDQLDAYFVRIRDEEANKWERQLSDFGLPPTLLKKSSP